MIIILIVKLFGGVYVIIKVIILRGNSCWNMSENIFKISIYIINGVCSQ
jgi:hypothetical protein